MTEPDSGEETLLEFPCEFPIKVMGKALPEFRGTVLDIIMERGQLLDGVDIREQPSRTGKYVSLTVSIVARNREQLDDIYQALTDCDEVLVAL
jgi:putative lipoic acid-binding regulatory protein